MKIKVCGLCQPANIRALAELRPDYMGFIFHPASPRYLAAHPGIREETAKLQHIIKVGVFVNENIGNITRTIETYQLDMVQLHGDEPPDQCRQVARIKPVIKAFRLDRDYDFSGLDAYQDACSYFLFDTASQQYGGTGKTFDWRLLEQYKLQIPFFLSGGIHPLHVTALPQIDHPALWAVDINSRFETSPGIKNTEQVKTFIHEIRN